MYKATLVVKDDNKAGMFDTDGAGYAIWDGCETVPVFCPLCGGRIGGR